jgi:mono/diheme cytochrome c family protein
VLKLTPIGLIVTVTALAIAAPDPTTRPTTNDTPVQPAQVADGVRSVPAYPVLWPEMPEHPAKNIYLANCVTCHSQLYVLMQPPFPRKTWQAEVEKMKKSYGAPIDDANMPQIVDYLMSVRGRGAK